MDITARDLQRLLTAGGYYNGGIDGDIGPKSLTAIDKILSQNSYKVPGHMSDARRLVASAQLILDAAGFEPGAIDGYNGHNTHEAFNAWSYVKEHGTRETLDRDETLFDTPDAARTDWPRQRDVTTFYGSVGTGQTLIDLPYAMVLAWDTKTRVTRMSCHERVADAMVQIFTNTIDHYGTDIHALGLDQFGGCLNVRKMRGGTSWSMHSWGIAVDLDPANNRLRWGRDRAKFARPEYVPFWNIVEDAGATSLGRQRNFDWMHFQFANL